MATFENFLHQVDLSGLNIPGLTEPNWLDTQAVKCWLDQVNQAIDQKILTLAQDAIHHIKDLIALRCLAVDVILIQLYQRLQFAEHLALFAVGGYGRGELLPASDIDILIIGDDIAKFSPQIEIFVAKLWDIGITPALAVRSLEETLEAVKDHTIATAMLEARHLVGNQDLGDFLQKTIQTSWQINDFFTAKMQESKSRYLSQNATEYNLEPNIKNAPGALRDIHVIGWIGRFYFQADGLESLMGDYINQEELVSLKNAQNFFWCLRHHLHTLTGRNEERLLFDHQKSIAKRFGYYIPQEHDSHTQVTAALEHMMRIYYRHAMQVAALSDMICANFQETYLLTHEQKTTLTEDFFVVTSSHDQPQIAAYDLEIFIKKPIKLLEIFLAMGQHGIKKIQASSLRMINQASRLIDDDFRQNPNCRRLFLANLQEENYLFHRLRLMKRHGVLGAYLPAFGKIIGLMQYDLFHRYTVDEHTLLLVRILHRFQEDSQDQYGLVSEIYQKIARKDLLIIAAIFHDIAKGRGGDHSQLGAIDADEFCQLHHLSDDDQAFVKWLVSEHLTMSLTAQKQDISDPEVIGKFANFTQSITRLNYLYVLTVADMNATNSQLWNTWRASLLKQLYINTHRALSLGYINDDKSVIIKSRQTDAKKLLNNLSCTDIDALWQSFGEDYFLKQKPTDIAWQTKEIIKHQKTLQDNQPIIAFHAHTDLSLGGIQLFLCAPNQENLFADTVNVLDQLGLSVLDASILTAAIDGVDVALDVYVLIDRMALNHQPLDFLSDHHRKSKAAKELTLALTQKNTTKIPKIFQAKNALKHFTVPTQVYFSKSRAMANPNCHQMQLVTKDRPALLAKIGQVFSQLSIKVHGARITTLGERAEDIFYISDKRDNPLDDKTLDHLKHAIIETLN